MKLKSYLMASAVCLFPFVVSAADLPVKASYKAAVVAPFSWTGCYVGGSAGLIMQGTTATDIDKLFNAAGDTYSVTGRPGGLFGLNGGCNYQTGNVVLGLEADIALSSLDNTISVNSGFPVVSSKLSSLGTVRGRIGYAFDRALLYATGGLAYGHVKNNAYDVTDPGYSSSTSGTRTGWTAGGGLEYAFMPHWTVRAEALYVDLGTATGSVCSSCRFGFKNTYTIGRLGVNYKF
jgi:outer membrane immunogenic protein